MNIKEKEKSTLLLLSKTMRNLFDHSPVFDFELEDCLDNEIIDFIKQNCTIRMSMKDIRDLPKDMEKKAMVQAVIQNL